MRRVRLSERDLSRIVRRIVKEERDEMGNFYSDVNSLIDEKYSDLDISDKINVLENILDNLNGQMGRGDRDSSRVSMKDVRRRFQ
jgi:hypothetical protein